MRGSPNPWTLIRHHGLDLTGYNLPFPCVFFHVHCLASERFAFHFPGVLKHQYHTPPARSNCLFQLSLSLAPGWAVRI